MINVIQTEIPGVVIIEPKLFGDERGYFMETWSQKDFDEQVRPIKFVQDNESKSCYGVLRGLHFQKGKDAQSKLVRVLKGRVLDVAVDIRKGSPTFGKYVMVELTGENHRQFFIPRIQRIVKILHDPRIRHVSRPPFFCLVITVSLTSNLNGFKTKRPISCCQLANVIITFTY